MNRRRAIGPTGTLVRIVVGLGLIAVAVKLDGVGWGDLALGLIGIPAVVTGPAGHLVNCVVVAALLVPSATRPATLVWLGISMLLAAWRGYAGCESLAISNWLLRRDDQVGRIAFWPLDAVEARMTGHRIVGTGR